MKYCSILPYNAEIKIAGNIITLKAYSKKQTHNYLVEPSLTSGKTVGEKIMKTYQDFMLGLTNTALNLKMYFKYRILGQAMEERKKERFIKSCFRARQNIFDLINCNVNKHKDYNDKKQTTKFLTLTFKENIKEIEIANRELTKFFKRLSYFNYGTRKNVIKYITVPELQERGAWHFHIVIFNMKYTHFTDLIRIWGQGGVYINALKTGMDGTEIAKYITKYISKALKTEKKTETALSYETYKKYGMINKKRYYPSKGLYKPFKRKIDTQTKEITMLANYLIEKSIDRKGEKQIYYNEYENEYRGEIQILTAELKPKLIKDFKNYVINMVDFNIQKYSKEQKINWGKLNNIREKQKQDLLIYDLEKRQEIEYLHYKARQRRWENEGYYEN